MYIFIQLNYVLSLITVVEKESISGERDLLLQLLSEAATEALSSQYTINSLNQIVAEDDSSSRYAVNDLERAKYLIKDKELTEQYEHAAEQIFHLTSELDKIHEELENSLKANKELNDKNLALEAATQVNKESREKERMSLISALSGRDALTAQVADIKNLEKDLALLRVKHLEEVEKTRNYEADLRAACIERDLAKDKIKDFEGAIQLLTNCGADLETIILERDVALRRVIDLEGEIEKISREMEREIEKTSNYEDKCESLQDEMMQMREELKGVKVQDKEQKSLISCLQEELVKAEEEQKDHIDLIYHLQNELEEVNSRGNNVSIFAIIEQYK
jgi:chromosome segregation ATPase